MYYPSVSPYVGAFVNLMVYIKVGISNPSVFDMSNCDVNTPKGSKIFCETQTFGKMVHKYGNNNSVYHKYTIAVV